MSDIIESKLASGERLTFCDGVRLFREFDFQRVGMMADAVRRELHGVNAYYIVNAHVNPTNICKICCPLCAFAAAEGDVRGYVLSVGEVLERVKLAVENNVTQIHLVSSIHPTKPFAWYCEIISAIHEAFPSLQIKAYTAVEIAAFADSAGKSIDEVLSELRSCGLSALPGGGAEIFDEGVRKKIAPNKISADVWLEVHRVAHKMGIVTNASMLFGHVETYEQRVEHIIRLRDLQDESIKLQNGGESQQFISKPVWAAGFAPEQPLRDATLACPASGISKQLEYNPVAQDQNAPSIQSPTQSSTGYFDCFVPLVYHGQNTQLSRTTHIEPISPQDILRTIAVSRLILRNIKHIKSYWVTLGESLAQVALSYGADDFDGTVFEEKIHHEAGSNTPSGLTEQHLQNLITGANKIPVKKN
ncbi:MAG: radical SAM protein [Planctomycetaceae bacterium]|nr:radical SAM protein [Planctomycetaceae bacterium]